MPDGPAALGRFCRHFMIGQLKRGRSSSIADDRIIVLTPLAMFEAKKRPVQWAGLGVDKGVIERAIRWVGRPPFDADDGRESLK